MIGVTFFVDSSNLNLVDFVELVFNLHVIEHFHRVFFHQLCPDTREFLGLVLVDVFLEVSVCRNVL